MTPQEQALQEYIDDDLTLMRRTKTKCGWWFHIIGIAVLDCDTYELEIAG